MITVRREVRTGRPLDVVAAYLSDFTTTQEWDPHTVSCSRLDPGGPVLGARYENVQRVLGRRTRLEYEVTRYEPGRLIELTGAGRNLDATDTMGFEAAPTGLGTGTLVVYEATFRFGGLAGRVEPLVRPLMAKVADDGRRGMAEALDRL